MGNASASLAACIAAIDAGESVLSLDGLAHSDSSAVAVLIAARRHAELAGRAVTVEAVPEAVASLAALYGVSDLIGAAPVPAPARIG
jgi:phospholipid transport system transporter-binding protein